MLKYQMMAYIDQSIKAVCPIDGVSFKKINDPATWTIQFRQEARPDQRQAAQAVIDGFNLSAWQAAQPSVKTLEERIAALEAKTGAL